MGKPQVYKSTIWSQGDSDKFSKLISTLLSSLSNVLPNLDDIIVYSGLKGEHLNEFSEVFQNPQETDLKLKA